MYIFKKNKTKNSKYFLNIFKSSRIKFSFETVKIINFLLK
jgi:hypothetical protein